MLFRKIFQPIFCFICCSLNSQVVSGEYSVKMETKVPSIFIYEFKVANNQMHEILRAKSHPSVINSYKTENEKGVSIEHISDEYKIVSSEQKPEYFKDSNVNKLFHRSFYLVDYSYVVENLEQINWEILGEGEYNGRKYNIAKAVFRGVKWIAYFDSLFPYNVYPWKFYGLPGMVVMVKREDEKVVYEMNKFKVDNESHEKIVNPFVNEKTISWEQYVANYKSYLLRTLKRMKADDEGASKISVENLMENFGFSDLE